VILLIQFHKFKIIFSSLFFCLVSFLHAQQSSKSDFWRNVQYGGGIGLGFSNNAFNASLSPSAIYQVSESFATGAGLNINYTSFNNNTLFAYGGSLLNFYNPIPQIQLSAELEQWRVNQSQNSFGDIQPNLNFWTTALFLGIGYRTRNVTIGLRYDIIDDDQSIYVDPLIPFVRFYF